MNKLFTLILITISISVNAQIEGTWRLAQIPGALSVGPSQADYSWWNSSTNDLISRSCIFDDSVTFDANGNFMHFMDGNTWLEPFQGVISEQCGSPVAPHDGSGSHSYVYINNQLTVNGTGAHLGLPKVVNGGEISTGAAVPSSITYEISLSSDGDTMTLEIDYAVGWWKFIYQRTSLAIASPPANYTVNFEVEVPNTVSVSSSIFLGGGIVGSADAVELSSGTNGVWCGSHIFPSTGGNYVFLNSPIDGGDWNAKEDLDGLTCADTNNWNDRLMPVLVSDTTLKLIFGSCDATTLACTVGMNEKDNNNFSIYPNPSNGIINIYSAERINTIKIYNVIGNLVKIKNIYNNQSTLNIENLINGIYFMVIDLKNGSSINSKFIKN